MSPVKYMSGIFAMALVVRLLAFWALPEPHMPYNAIFAYVKGAHMLIEGQGFSDISFPVYTPPLYSIFIAIVTVLFGDGILAIKIVQIVADSSTAVFLYLIVRKVFDDPTGLMSGGMWACYPFTIYSTLYIGTEAFFTFFIALFVLLITYGIRNDKWYWYCAAGFLLGMATLIRGTTQFIPLVLPLVLFASRKEGVHWLRNSALSLVCFILVILPWGARNYIVLHEIIPVGANSTVILYGISEPLLTIETRQKELARLFA
ncbi:MAG: glycosyltransferase family 39 protein, partial [Nitrospirales bacterium]|nr:glycosyltransferase family 39 protein [Nitrospirales bacterium]